jgi:hypothetical protein
MHRIAFSLALGVAGVVSSGARAEPRSPKRAVMASRRRVKTARSSCSISGPSNRSVWRSIPGSFLVLVVQRR